MSLTLAIPAKLTCAIHSAAINFTCCELDYIVSFTTSLPPSSSQLHLVKLTALVKLTIVSFTRSSELHSSLTTET